MTYALFALGIFAMLCVAVAFQKHVAIVRVLKQSIQYERDMVSKRIRVMEDQEAYAKTMCQEVDRLNAELERLKGSTNKTMYENGIKMWIDVTKPDIEANMLLDAIELLGKANSYDGTSIKYGNGVTALGASSALAARFCNKAERGFVKCGTEAILVMAEADAKACLERFGELLRHGTDTK